jgi:hypothetical protein
VLAPLTIAGSAALAAGIASAAAVLARQRGVASGWLGALLIGGGTIVVGAVAAFFLCGAARWFDLFPVGGEGWELIFDPLGAALVAVPLTALGLGAAALARRLAR